jgi:hypothetical protein
MTLTDLMVTLYFYFFFAVNFAVTLEVMNWQSFAKYIKEGLIELDIDLNLTLTLKVKLVKFPSDTNMTLTHKCP